MVSGTGEQLNKGSAGLMLQTAYMCVYVGGLFVSFVGVTHGADLDSTAH